MAERVEKSSLLSSEVKERLETLSENVAIVIKQIINDSRGGPHSLLSQEEFHSNLRSNVAGLSDSCTKLSLLFCSPSSPPSLNETGTICSKVENATLGLTSTYYQCKTEWGKCHYKDVKGLVIDILKGVSNLSNILMKEGCKSDCRERLQGTGSVWEHCDRVVKLPCDNKSSVSRHCLTQLQLLRDANSEIEELAEANGSCDVEMSLEELSISKEGGDNEEDSETEEWSEADKIIVTPSIELIKLSSDLTDRICRSLLLQQPKCALEQFIKHLDALVDLVEQLSPIVDELASSLEAPIDRHSLETHGGLLQRLLLDIVEHMMSSDTYGNSSEIWKEYKVKIKTQLICKTY